MTTVLAHVRLRPTPHLSDMSSTGTPGSWKRITWPRVEEVRPQRLGSRAGPTPPRTAPPPPRRGWARRRHRVSVASALPGHRAAP
eukprot:scaffold7804_cov65-Phaeocystis_antarctica.AAC.4